MDTSALFDIVSGFACDIADICGTLRYVSSEIDAVASAYQYAKTGEERADAKCFLTIAVLKLAPVLSLAYKATENLYDNIDIAQRKLEEANIEAYRRKAVQATGHVEAAK